MYDVSTLYVNRETFRFAGLLSKFNHTRLRSHLGPSFCRLDGHREGNRFTNQPVKQGDTFRILKSFFIHWPGKKGIPHFPRIHTMLAGFLDLAK
jgi:hypothetical protein